MKTRKQKVIFRILCTIVSILLLASFFAVPVSAADGAYYKFRPNFDFDTANPSYMYQKSMDFADLALLNNTVQVFGLDKIEPADYDGDFATFEFRPKVYSESSYTGLILPLGFSTLSKDNQPVFMSQDDTLYLEAGRFYADIDTELDALIKVRFTLRPVYNNPSVSGTTFSVVYAYTDTLDIYISSGSKSYFDYDILEFTYSAQFEDGIETPVFLCVEFLHTTADALDITVLNIEATTARLFYASGSSPNNPVFPSAPGKDDVDGLGSAEHELIQSQQQGINQGLTVMGDTSTVLTDLNTSLQLGTFTTRLSGILDRAVSIPGLQALLQVSLSLGLFASLLALSASIVGAADRKAGQAKRDAARQSSAARRLAERKNKSR